MALYITSNLAALAALMTFVLNALLLEPSIFMDRVSVSRLFRISPLVCIYEVVWDLLDVATYVMTDATLPTHTPAVQNAGAVNGHIDDRRSPSWNLARIFIAFLTAWRQFASS